MFGPVGLLFYFIIRVALRHQIQIQVANANVDVMSEIWRYDRRLALTDWLNLAL